MSLLVRVGTWSLVQNSMVMAYLSYADFYRPRYFLLENVRNFVSHNKSHAFRLTLRSLLDMGYQASPLHSPHHEVHLYRSHWLWTLQ